MLEFDLTEEQRALQRLARDFAEREMRPIGMELDLMDPRESFPWELVKKGSQLGFRTMPLPPEWGGMGADLLTQVVVIDEFSYADTSCCKIFSQSWKVCRHLYLGATEEQKSRYIPQLVEDDTFLMAMAFTEPDTGADNSLYYDPPPGQGLMLRAERNGDHYILNGMKHFIGLGSVAKLYIIRARTDPTVHQSQGVSHFIVPRETPGFSIGTIHDKIGFRASPNAELLFDNVKVPVEDVLGGEEGLVSQAESYMATVGNIEMAAYVMGLSRAAFDAAVKFANERFQGGKVIIQHQAVQSALADLYITLQAGRSLLWRAAWTSTYKEPDAALGRACRVFCVDAAVKITIGAMELFGGVGVMRDLPMQKYVRDALINMHGDGTTRLDRLMIGTTLESQYQQGLLRG